MRILKTKILIVVFAAAFMGGCAPTTSSIPTNLKQYQALQGRDSESYPDYVIVQHNMARAMESEIPAEKRVESLQLVNRIGVSDPDIGGQIASILSEKNCPPRLQKAALEFLLSQGHPGIAEHVVKLLPQAEPGSDLRREILRWLTRHARPDVLSEVVSLWAQEPSKSGPNEPLFRQIVERITGNKWDAALIDALNSSDFKARGSAIAILHRRVSQRELRRRIMQINPVTDACRAIKIFAARFNYIPSGREGLIAAVTIMKTQDNLLGPADRLADKWSSDYGYRFDIRDFHLISHIATDPLRPDMRRTQLILELTRSLTRREHVYPPSLGRRASFARQADMLSMPDLWNLYLLDEMLSRRWMRKALKLTARRDRRDESTAWGGLIFYENGRATAKLYEPSRQGSSDDKTYTPSSKMEIDGLDALCRFCTHFEKIDNASRAGPTKQELRRAQNENFYGLVLTSLSERKFCAHYYNPEGNVISLGVYYFVQ